MKLNYFCCIGAELKRQRIDFDYMNQVYIYVLSGTETLNQVKAANFFNDVAVSLQPNDIIFVYSGANNLYTPYKVIKDIDNNVTISELINNSLKDLIDSLPATIGNLQSDGSIPMDITYTPTADQEIATKKYVDDNAGEGNLKSDGSVSMDTGYTPTTDLQIATKEYADDAVSTVIGGLGDLASLDTVGSAQIDTGAIGVDELNATAISGQTDATIASDDTLLFLDATDGALYRDTVQGVVDVTKDYLFDQSSATLNGTEKVSAEQSGTAITVTTQDIADLASGGGISVTSQTLQATTITTDGNFFHPAILKNIIDGKLLQVRRAASTNYPLLLSVLTVATDGTVSFGSETSYAESTDKLSLTYNVRLLFDLVKLSATKFLMMFTNETDFSLNVALLTVDTDANTVTVNNSYIILDETDATGFMAQGARILGVDGTTAVIVYQSGITTSSTTKGRVITLDSATTLAIGAEQTIVNNASYNGQLIDGLVSPYANNFVITGWNTDYTHFVHIPFTRSGNTLTLKGTTPIPFSGITAGRNQASNIITYSKDKVVGTLITNVNATAIALTPTISQGEGVCLEGSYNVDSTNSNVLISPMNSGAIRTIYPYGSLLNEDIPWCETDKAIIFGSKSNNYGCEQLFIFTKYNCLISSVILEGLTTGVSNIYQFKNSIAKVRDGQYMVLFNLPTTYYLHYLPVLIEGVD